MRLAYLCLSLPLMMLAGTACAGEEDLGCTADAQCREGRVCIDNACAPDTSRRDHEYFGQFVHEVSGTHVRRWKHWPGEGAWGGFRLTGFLMENGDATIFYEEGFSGHGFNPRNREDGSDPRRRITTSWSIVDDKLIVGDVLVCTAAPAEEPEYDFSITRDGILCEIQRTIMDERTKGLSVLMINDTVSSSPDDEEFSEFADE